MAAQRPDEDYHSDDEAANDEHRATEHSPLLQDEHDVEASGTETPRHSSAASALRSLQGKPATNRRRWPSIVALLVLCAIVIVIICVGFLAPSVVEEYANDAIKFEPTALSIDKFTMHGVRARVQGRVSVHADRVTKPNVRRMGRFATWLAREVRSGNTTVKVSLPDYDSVILGSATIPPIKVRIRNGASTDIDVLTDLIPGQLSAIKDIANDWLHGRIHQLRVAGTAKVPVNTGILPLGTHALSQTLLFDAKNASSIIPAYDLTKLDLYDRARDSPAGGIAADVSIAVNNDFPINLDLPAMDFAISVQGCTPSQPHILMANATTSATDVHRNSMVNINVTGLVTKLPDSLLEPCKGKQESPLDMLLTRYIAGKDVTLYVRGAKTASSDVPDWVADIASEITVPVPFRGHALGQLLRDFKLSDVDFGLPEPFAEPGSPETQPTISATVSALIALPKEINFGIDVSKVRADTNVFYKGSKLGKLDLSHWQAANSSRVDSSNSSTSDLMIHSSVEKAPLNITDDDVFTQVFRALLFGEKDVILDIEADVDVQVKTALGEVVLRKIPAKGSVPIKPIGKDAKLSAIKPRINRLQILETSSTSLTVAAWMNFTNPTEYTAHIPLADVYISYNGSRLGHVQAKALDVGPGVNTDRLVILYWHPVESAVGSAISAHAASIDFLSAYISGEETNLTITTHADSFPHQPRLGRVLSGFPIELPTPPLRVSRPRSPDDPDDGDDDDEDDDDGGDDGEEKSPTFISDATMHLLSSTAIFTIYSPLTASPLTITYINATAIYKDETVGVIQDYNLPFVVPPGGVPVQSPRLPVDWSFGSVGYDALRNALGGSLKLEAQALVGVRLGRWEERLHFRGKGIGAKVCL